MTTVAWDGKVMAADTLAVDSWGLKETRSKLMRGRGGKGWIAGFAGDIGAIERWKKESEFLDFKRVLERGVPNWHKDDNDPSILITDGGVCYRAVGGVFLRNDRQQFAIGSGRDFALATMHLGYDSKRAIEVAMHFDNNSGGYIEMMSVDGWILP